jgi:YfaZ precursor
MQGGAMIKYWLTALLATCAFVSAQAALAQTPLAESTARAIDATVGNQVLQLRYLDRSPMSQVAGNLDYGVLLTENREFVASAALMFDTNFVPLSRLHLQLGPQANLAWLATGSKTDVFALALGAGARYDLIRRLGLSAFGSAFYSPGVLTFGQAHNLYDFTAGAELRLAGRLYGLAGYRWFKFTLVNQPDERLVNEVFAGVRWQLE